MHESRFSHGHSTFTGFANRDSRGNNVRISGQFARPSLVSSQSIKRFLTSRWNNVHPCKYGELAAHSRARFQFRDLFTQCRISHGSTTTRQRRVPSIVQSSSPNLIFNVIAPGTNNEGNSCTNLHSLPFQG